MTTSTTLIRFWVRVPVLSVQMKVVAPSVSTASRRRTSALRAAMVWAPRASDRVTVGSRPSGTSATATPTPNRKAWVSPRPEREGGRAQQQAGERGDDGDDPDHPVQLHREWARRALRGG